MIRAAGLLQAGPESRGPRSDVEDAVPAQDERLLPRGRMLLRKVPGRTGGKFYVYLPRAWNSGRPLLVAVHGIARNAREQVLQFAPWAERHGFAVVAPLFSRDRYSDYQRLGLEKGTRRADDFLDNVLDTVAQWTGSTGPEVHLFGFSGGAQFAHRYALFHPGRVRSVVLGAAGWYTMPDPRHAFPLGLGELPLPTLLTLWKWLTLPMLVVVGSRDTERDASLRQTLLVDETQGLTRIERGERFVRAVRNAALRHGLEPRVEFATLEGVGHDFTEAMSGGLAALALPFLGLTAPMKSGDPA